MVDVTENWFYENDDLQNYEVADFLEEILQNEFSLRIDDGSLLEVGTYVTEYFKICTTPSYSQETVLNFLRCLPKCDLSKCQVLDEDEEMEVNKDVTEESLTLMNDMDISEKKEEAPEVDEEGFEMVKSRKKKK